MWEEVEVGKIRRRSSSLLPAQQWQPPSDLVLFVGWTLNENTHTHTYTHTSRTIPTSVMMKGTFHIYITKAASGH